MKKPASHMHRLASSNRLKGIRAAIVNGPAPVPAPEPLSASVSAPAPLPEPVLAEPVLAAPVPEPVPAEPVLAPVPELEAEAEAEAEPVQQAVQQAVVAPGGVPPVPAVSRLKVLIVSHMHPRVSRGGAEIAAYQMYAELKAMPDVEAWFVGASGGKVDAPLGVAVFQPFGPDEFVIGDAAYDHWSHSAHNPKLAKEFRLLLEELRPDVIHFHHFANIGVEAFLHIKQTLPDAKIIVTLHEFLAICNYFGQMVKRGSMELCEESSPRACHKCFPERSENDFFLRKLYLQRFFSLVDHLIAPSHFLAHRYIDWGLDAGRISVVENGQPPLDGAIAPLPDPAVLVVGFFGQLSSLKGVDVVLDAVKELRKRPPSLRPVRIEIHGDASNQPPELRDEIERRLAANRATVSFRGAYDNRKVHALMQECHAVLVPSTWWENSPLVIQEAFASRRPVLCSDIGGMAEKVRHGLDGFHFRARSGVALADLLRDLANHPGRLDAVQQTLIDPQTLQTTVTQVKRIYESLAMTPEVVREAVPA